MPSPTARNRAACRGVTLRAECHAEGLGEARDLGLGERDLAGRRIGDVVDADADRCARGIGFTEAEHHRRLLGGPSGADRAQGNASDFGRWRLKDPAAFSGNNRAVFQRKPRRTPSRGTPRDRDLAGLRGQRPPGDTTVLESSTAISATEPDSTPTFSARMSGVSIDSSMSTCHACR
jgi:hypothetical protein